MLLKHLTNTIMDNAGGASSSSSDPELSSTFSRLLNRDNTYRRIEEQGSFHNSENDIAD